MSWLYFTILAYLVNAVAFIIDKYLLVTHIPRPFVYAFGVAVLSASAVVLIPFGVMMQGAEFLSISLASGASFFVALIFLYNLIKESDVSVATTMSGVATAVFSYFLAIPLLGESPDVISFATMAILIIGMLFLGRTDKKVWFLAFWAGLFFSASFVLLKVSFGLSDFVNGLFWTRVGFVGVALVSLIARPLRNDVVSSFRSAHPKVGMIFIGNKILAAGGFLILYYAISLGKVSVVNSLLGFQFLFIFILALLLRSRMPKIEENVDKRHIVQKIFGIAFVIAGFLVIIIL